MKPDTSVYTHWYSSYLQSHKKGLQGTAENSGRNINHTYEAMTNQGYYSYHELAVKVNLYLVCEVYFY